MIYYQKGSASEILIEEDLKAGLYAALDKAGVKKKVLIIPPDFSRQHSRAGFLTYFAWEYYGDKLKDILPALGTHTPMTEGEKTKMFPGVPAELFRPHRWREDCETIGTVPPEFIRRVSNGILDFSWPAQINRLITSGGHDLILSIGQVVPHEVIGMANYNKNLFVGTGGKEGIDKSHYLGAVCGLENIMGKADTPVRDLLNYASEKFAQDLPVIYVLTVVEALKTGDTVIRGLFIGDDSECFYEAAKLSRMVNITKIDKPLKKIVVYLNPEEFKSTWIGNKSIYRSRMAIENGGELIILAPGVKTFGEDPSIDRIIRKYGYRGFESIHGQVAKKGELSDNLTAAAHLIHGFHNERFSITYCPGGLTKGEIEGVNYGFGDLASMIKRYQPSKIDDGVNILPGGEEFYFISNPALGLWISKEEDK